MPPFDEIRDMLLYGILPALAAAILVTAALERFGGPRQTPAAAGLALLIGALAGLWMRAATPLLVADMHSPLLSALRDALNLTNHESTWNRLPWAVLAALCAGRLASVLDTHTQDGWLLRGSAALGIAWWVIPEDAREVVWLAPSFAAVVFLEWELLERLSAQPPDGSVPFCLAMAFLTAGMVLLFAGIARWMEVAVLCASALAGIGLVASWRRADVSGIVPVAAVLLPSLLLMGQRETSVTAIPWYVFALAALSPLMLAPAWPLRQRGGVGRYLLRLALILVPLIAAVLLTRLAIGPDEDW